MVSDRNLCEFTLIMYQYLKISHITPCKYEILYKQRSISSEYLNNVNTFNNSMFNNNNNNKYCFVT